jgi:ferredoxin
MNDIVERKVSDFIVKIERPTCIGSKNCISATPDLFELDDEQICSFKENTEGIPQENIVEACSVCPVSALFVYDLQGNQLVP